MMQVALPSRELKLCPFCGHIGIIEPAPVNYGKHFLVRCSHCPCAMMMDYQTFEEAVQAWNHRPSKKEQKIEVLEVIKEAQND